jgi:serine/threonine-protein kinase
MTTNKGDRFRELSMLFDEVVDLDEDSREALIAERCADRPELERELRDLLAADVRGASDEFVQAVVASEAAALTSPDVRGRQLGSWRIIETLGEGGMGTVYLADRADGEYEARAAIKLVRGGIPSPVLTERFRAERQILAGLSHPGVAKLLDGGSTEDGTPFLVMEFIDGQPITEFCADRELDVEMRLRLLLKVCESVTYAHAELVAHRDLKPSNILVTQEGEPKLLDFGIAKLMEDLGEAGDGVTQGYTVMTPAYSSPEQVSGERAGVAADVYSLGVLLYELLTDRLPLETRGLTPVQLISKVTQEVPAVASSVVEEPARRRRLSGDLDAIVSRALRKEPERRYVSVEALAEDVRLHLDGMPIRARNDDWSYRTGKLVRRNRGVVSGGLLMLILGVSFTINTLLQARAVGRERDRADAQRIAAQRVSSFLEELFTEADPNLATAGDLTVRELLDRGAGRVLTDLDSEPEIQASLALVMGRVYRAIGEYEGAEPLLDSALAVRERTSSAAPAELGEGYGERGALAYDLGEYEAAVDLHRRSLSAYQEAVEGDDVSVASALDWLAVALTELGEMEEAEEYSRMATDMYRRIDPTPNADLASSLTSLQDVLRANGKVDEAVAVGEEALAMGRAVYGDNHLEVAHALNQMASSLRDARRMEEAVPLVEEGLAIRRAAFDGPHVEIAASLGNLANMLFGLDRVDEALVHRRASVDMIRDIFPFEHPYVAASMSSLGSVLLQMNRLDEAEAALLESVESHRLAFPPQHPNLGAPLTSLGRVYRAQGRLRASRVALQEAYDVRSGGMPAGHWHIAASGLELGRTLDAMERDVEAEAMLREALAILSGAFGPEDPRSIQASDALSEHLIRRGLVEGG